MVGYTKAEYHAQYANYLRYPDGRRMANYKGPEFPGTLEGTVPPVRVKHYSPAVEREKAKHVADLVLEKYTITSSDKVIIFGGAFGWLGEALEAKVGCKTICLDLSDWVQQVKDRSPDAELEEAVIASGLDPTTGNGLKIMQDFHDPKPYATITVDNRDMREMKDRRDFMKDRGEYTVCITEDVWQILSAQEQADYEAAFEDIGVTTLIHYMDGRVF